MLIGARSLLIAFIFFLFFSVTYKDDADTMLSTIAFTQLQLPSYVNFLKTSSQYFLIVPAIAVILSLFKKSRPRSPGGPGVTILAILAVFVIFRLSPSDSTKAVQIFVSVLIYATLFVMMVAAAGIEGRAGAATALADGMSLFAFFHVALNLLVLASGVGFQNNRFYGTSSHPNFMGVQMAVCAIVLWASGPSSFRRRILRRGTAIIAIVIMILTGSRTAILLCCSGLATFYTARGVRPAYALASVIIFALALVALITFTDPVTLFAANQYDRGGVNTREDAWADMWGQVQSSPLWGTGKLPLSSESSYLRGWAAVGLIYPAAFACFLIYTIVALFGASFRRQMSVEIALFAAVTLGMLVAAIFEGFLFESFAFGIYAFLASCLGLDCALKAGRERTDNTVGDVEFGLRDMARY